MAWAGITSRLRWALLPLAFLGCTTGADTGASSGRASGGAWSQTEADDGAAAAETALLPVTDPERTQRAREIYLGGVGLLSRTPPQVEPAIREFQQALNVDPRFYRAHFKLGICYYHQGLYELEINEYKKCLAINPGYVPALLNLGHAHLAKDELEQARTAYEEVLRREPNHAVAIYNKALVELDLGNQPESLRLFRAFVELDGQGEMGQRAKQYIEELSLRTKGQGS